MQENTATETQTELKPRPDVRVRPVVNADEFKDVRRIRTEVFVFEQGVPSEVEWSHEEESNHFLAWIDGQAVGTARWRATEPTRAKLERFAVLTPYRTYGVGSLLLENILDDLRRHPQVNMAYLHAQLTAAPFYDKHGFARVGEEFWEAGIAHIRMEKGLLWLPD